MNKDAIILTVALCLGSMILELFGTSKNGKKWFESLKQPKYSFPFFVWYFVGGLYYLMCGIIAYRLFAGKINNNFIVVMILLILMMLFNGLTNFLLFKAKSIRLFYYSIYPFSLIVMTLFALLIGTDRISAWILFPYLVWLIYDSYYFRGLWKLNLPVTGNY